MLLRPQRRELPVPVSEGSVLSFRSPPYTAQAAFAGPQAQKLSPVPATSRPIGSGTREVCEGTYVNAIYSVMI